MAVSSRTRHHVFLASNMWGDLWITQQPVCYEIQRSERILYVERPVSVFTVIRYPRMWRRLFTWLLGARTETGRLSLLAPLPLFHMGHRFPLLFAAEFYIQRLWIMIFARRLGSGERVLWIDNPLYHLAFHKMGESVRVYYAADEFPAFPQSHRPTAEALEQAAVSSADLVFAAASGLADRKRPLNPHTHAIWNAIDAALFFAPDDISVAAEVEAVPEPRVSFVGVLAEWVDVDLLRDVASLMPDVHFVVVGPSRIDDAALRQLANVHWFGPRPRAEVPTILRRCSASLVPFRRTRLTESILPLKVFEALAAGVMPVCTPFSSDLDILARDGLVAAAEGCVAFASAIRRAVEADTPSQRTRLQAFGLRQTWADRWRQMEAVITDSQALRRATAKPATKLGTQHG